MSQSPGRDWSCRQVTGWGRSRRAEMLVGRPQTPEALAALVAEGAPEGGGLLPLGAGRSYGDVGLNAGGAGLDMTALAGIERLDLESGRAVILAGSDFDGLIDALLPLGFLPPVTPGTAFATLGGALANDVHGKNHDRVGSFGNHLLWFDLLTPDGTLRRVSPDSEPRLFAATLGGIGLTGTVLRLCLKLQRVAGDGVLVAERRIANLEGFLEAFERARREAAYSVAWIDALARGPNLGRGILETATPLDGPLTKRPRGGGGPRFGVPCDLPGMTLSPLSIAAFNELYYRRIPKAGRERPLPYRQFFYPLDAIGAWNRIYGAAGFYQFQCVLPDGEAARGLPRLMERIAAGRAASFLAVLKTLGSDGLGYLSFPRRGYTLALDFPRRPGIEDLLKDLERLTLDHGGRIYLAKDALLSPEGFRRMYPHHGELTQVLLEIDPERRFRSDMARRLGLL